MRILLSLAALASLGVTAAAPAIASNHGQHQANQGHDHGASLSPAATAALAEALAHERRAGDRARDQHRNPAETLAFFQVEPGMTVVDYMPAGGWYSRVLIPYLGADGHYIALDPDLHPRLTGFWDGYRNTATRFPAEAAAWVGDVGAQVSGFNTNDDLSAVAGSVDRVLIFREIHNMRRADWWHGSMTAIRQMLKPDGMVGVVQHRAYAGAPFSYVLGDNGYQREEDVIALFGAYGFELVGKSEMNANPADPANWEGGVWTLPPGYRGTPPTDTARRAELDAIGESDRMTLLFRMVP